MTDEEIRKASEINGYINPLMDQAYKDGFIKGAQWYRSQTEQYECSRIQCIPYQICPICNGQGRVVADGFTSSVYQVCDVCNGMKIIPMQPLQQPPKTNNH
jgi:hypothetical protein